MFILLFGRGALHLRSYSRLDSWTYTTAAGTHTVTVSVSGTTNASSNNTYVIFDAFIVGT
jgi:hypothetical protein